MRQRAVMLLSFSLLLLEATGARIRVGDSLDASKQSFGPDGAFTKGTKYACIEKWQKAGSSFQGKFCLVDFSSGEAGFEHLNKKEWTSCESKSFPHQLKLCALKDKGKPESARLSYDSKMHVPKSCFAKNSEDELEARVTPVECEQMLKWLDEDQLNFGPAIDTPVIEELEPTCKCEDGFAAKMVDGECKCMAAPCGIAETTGDGLSCQCNKGFTGDITWNGAEARGECKPAFCGIVGTTGDGPSCKCASGLQGEIEWDGSTPSGVCHVEAKSLFSEATLLWEIKGEDKDMRIKCCASSQGKPTKLQDLNAENLPSERFAGDKTGCGRMFGDTYHNAMDFSHFSQPSCFVTVAEIAEIIKSLPEKDQNTATKKIVGDFEDAAEVLKHPKTRIQMATEYYRTQFLNNL